MHDQHLALRKLGSMLHVTYQLLGNFMILSVTHGCSKCLKTFPTQSFGGKPDYTGFNRTLWEPRSKESHYQHAMAHKNCETGQQQKIIEGVWM